MAANCNLIILHGSFFSKFATLILTFFQLFCHWHGKLITKSLHVDVAFTLSFCLEFYIHIAVGFVNKYDLNKSNLAMALSITFFCL